MAQTDPAPAARPGMPPVRFVIVSDARTGSNVLVEALNSHPNIACFREVMNPLLPDIDYAVAGYDGTSAADKDLRASDPARFLQERIYSGHEAGVHAVGFKFPYTHLFGTHGAIEGLIGDRSLRVIHLQRRNALRSLVSRRLAEATGLWYDPGTTARPLAAPTSSDAPSKPLRASIGAVVARVRARAAEQPAPSMRIQLRREECLLVFKSLRANVQLFDSLFEEHQKVTVWYEEMVAGPDAQADIMRFLEVEPLPLQVSMRRQNPQPLSALIENYGELKRDFAGTSFAAFFED